jgi:LacI family transcriptional regulator
MAEILTIGVIGFDAGMSGIMRFRRRRPAWHVLHLANIVERYQDLSSRCDGVIAAAGQQRHLKLLSEQRLPTVNVSAAFAPGDVPQVVVDNDAVGRQAAVYLADRGLTRFAYMGVPGRYFNDCRKEGFRQELHGRGLNCRVLEEELPRARYPWSVFGPNASELEHWLRDLPKPVGLFAADDAKALDCLLACRNADLSVPHDVAVLGANDHASFCESITPELSSVQVPWEPLGFAAARTLDQMMLGESVPPVLLLPPTGVTERHSTEVLQVDDAVVRRALQFIAERVGEPIGVEEVVAAVPVSRRQLERRFAENLGRTPLQEIHRVRLNRARDLLARTGMSVVQIADLCGFGSDDRFVAAFRKETGYTPAAWRRQLHAPTESKVEPH